MTTAIITPRTSDTLTAAIAYGGEFHGWLFESAEVEPGTAWDDIVTYHGKAAGKDKILLGYLVTGNKAEFYWDAAQAYERAESMEDEAGEDSEDTIEVLEVVLTRELHEAHSA